MPRRDWVGHWLSLTEKRGELMAIRYGHLGAPPSASTSGSGASDGVTWRLLPHAEFDGLGGLGALLAEAGTPPDGGLPSARGLAPFSLSPALAAFARSLAGEPSPARFRAQDTAFRPVPGDASRAQPAASAMAFHLFSARETRAIVEGARAMAITVNSLLLWALARAVGPELVPGSGESVWLVPVNMRGLVRKAREGANHISFMNVPVPLSSTPRQAHAAVRSRLDRAAHWGGWLVGNLGEILGERGVERVARAQDPRRASVVGVLSNLGALSGPGGGSWLFCPPVTYAQPIGAGALTWNGRLSLLLQLHPSLPRAPEDVAALLSRFRDGALAAFDAR